jgi:hypothetical protein
MQKKKLIPIVILVVFSAILGVVSLNLLSGKGKSNNRLDDFLVADTAAVDKLIISQSSGYSIELVRNGNQFVTSTGDCVQEEMIDNILHTFTKVAVRSFVPENSVETLRNNIRVNYRKVQIFQNGNWVKTWWIGNATPDHYGTYALLETPGEGVSEIPVILEMRGLRGSIESRFTADGRSWVCSQVFNHAMADIQSVTVEHNEAPQQNFKINRVGSGRAFKITDYRNNAVVFDTLKLVRYLDLFKKANFESVNFTLTAEQVDSMKRVQPWIAIQLQLTNGQKITLDAHRMKAPEGDTDLTGNPIEWDVNRLWAIIDNKKLVKIQYFTFDPFFVDVSYFGGAQYYSVP